MMIKLKMIFFTTILLMLGIKTNAQFATYDAAVHQALERENATSIKNFVKNSEILVKAENTLKTLKNMKKTYDEWSTAIREVNDIIRTGKEILNIINTTTEMGEDYKEAIDLISNTKGLSFNQREVYITVFTNILGDAISSLNDGTKIITNGNYEMNDAERLSFMREIEKKVDDKQSLLLYALKKFKYAVREAQVVEYNNNVLKSTMEAVKN